MKRHYNAPAGVNPALAAVAEQKRRKRELINTAVQMTFDISCLTANEVFGMGSGRAQEYMRVFREKFSEFSKVITDDAKDDAEIEYAKSVLDRELERIIGKDNFVPWDERYNFS